MTIKHCCCEYSCILWADLMRARYAVLPIAGGRQAAHHYDVVLETTPLLLWTAVCKDVVMIAAYEPSKYFCKL